MPTIYKITGTQIYCEASSIENAVVQFNLRGLNVSKSDIFKPYDSRGNKTGESQQPPVNRANKPKG